MSAQEVGNGSETPLPGGAGGSSCVATVSPQPPSSCCAPISHFTPRAIMISTGLVRPGSAKEESPTNALHVPTTQLTPQRPNQEPSVSYCAAMKAMARWAARCACSTRYRGGEGCAWAEFAWQMITPQSSSVRPVMSA